MFSIVDALRLQLSWTHYRLLLRLEKTEARAFYETEAINAGWSTRELERQINSLLFERLALSRDKEGVMELATRGHEVCKPEDLVKDPYVLEFTGIRQDERFLEADLERSLTRAGTLMRPLRCGTIARLRKKFLILHFEL